MIKMPSFCHLHYNDKILHIYKKNFPINYFCCFKRKNMDGAVLYLPALLLWNSLLCADPRDTY